MKEFLKDILRQLFGMSKLREGKLVLTYRGTREMYQNQLYPEILENTFRYGVEIRKGLIVKKHAKYIVGLYYKYDEAEKEHRITFVYKN